MKSRKFILALGSLVLLFVLALALILRGQADQLSQLATFAAGLAGVMGVYVYGNIKEKTNGGGG